MYGTLTIMPRGPLQPTRVHYELTGVSIIQNNRHGGWEAIFTNDPNDKVDIDSNHSLLLNYYRKQYDEENDVAELKPIRHYHIKIIEKGQNISNGSNLSLEIPVNDSAFSYQVLSNHLQFSFIADALATDYPVVHTNPTYQTPRSARQRITEFDSDYEIMRTPKQATPAVAPKPTLHRGSESVSRHYDRTAFLQKRQARLPDNLPEDFCVDDRYKNVLQKRQHKVSEDSAIATSMEDGYTTIPAR